MNYLIFDTETTGLPKNWKAPVQRLDNWPRLVQLAWILYDEQGKDQLKHSRIIKPEGFTIPHDAARVHGITTARALREGEPLVEVLQEFCGVVNRDNLTLVAHNIAFDEKIIGAELLRMNLASKFFELPKICTMKSSIDFCNLPNKKYPGWENFITSYLIRTFKMPIMRIPMY